MDKQKKKVSIVNKYLTEGVNPLYNDNVDCYIFDFDHVVVLFDKKFAGKSVRGEFIKIMTKRKREKKDFIKCAKELGISYPEVKVMLKKLIKELIPNPKIISLLQEIKKHPNKITVLATNNSPVVVNYCLAEMELDYYFDEKFFPEMANWTWKPDRKYFMTLQNLLDIPFKRMWFIDDDKDNTNGFKMLGGNVTWYRRRKNA